MSDPLLDALAGLTARRDKLNAAISALENVIGPAAPAIKVPWASPRRAVKTKRPAPARAAKATPAPPKRATTVRPAPVKRVTTAGAAAERSTLIAAREDAILTALRRHEGLAKSDVLRRAMPKEPDLNEEQRDDAYRNTMTRLKGKGAIGRTGDTWSISGLGSERG